MGDTVISTYPQPELSPAEAPSAEEMVAIAALAAREGDVALRVALDALPAPIYTTDAEGWVTYCNAACVDFAGREPALGKDRWCVTWKLFCEDGQPMAHCDCPMAIAVRERREVRGVVAVAERPDGTRVLFTPYPTPLHDADGEFRGAVNILVDVTDPRQPAALRREALRCRRLADAVTDRRAIEALEAMAREYEARAQTLENRSDR